jgi:Flp pilus assembly protein TadD
MNHAASALAGIGAALGVSLLAACAGTPPVGTRDQDNASRFRVAAAAEASGQADIALSMYAAAAAAEPNRAEVQARFASALSRNGNVAQAEQVLSRAIVRQRDDPVLLAQLGRLRLQSGAAAEALEVFGRLLNATPRNIDALDGRGVALDLLGRHAEAEQSYRAALALAPDSLRTANNLAMSLLLAGRGAEAAAILERLARFPAAPPRVLANLAVARATMGDRDGAESLLRGSGGNGDVDAIIQALSGDATAKSERS